MAMTSTMNVAAAAVPPPPPPLGQQNDSTAASFNHQKESAALDPSSVDQSTMKSKKSNGGDDKREDDDDNDAASITIFDDNFNATTIADQLSHRLEQAFQSSVAQLPMLRQPDVLLQRLRHSYLRNVDIFEVYCSRNLFTLDNITSCSSNNKRLRQRVVQLYREIKHSSDVVLPALHTNDNDSNKTFVAVQPLVLPEQANSNNVGPTLASASDDEEMTSLQEEMTSLRQRLVTAQKTRVDLLRCLTEMEQAERLAKMALEAAQAEGQQLDNCKLHDSMTAVAVGAQGLLLYDQQGREHLLESISNNNNKRNRSDMMGNDENKDNAWNCMLLVDKKKSKTPWSALEQYQQEKEQIVVVMAATVGSSNAGAGAADDLAKVQQLILGQRQEY